MRNFILSLVALIGICGAAALGNNYLMTQGSGTTFGSLLSGGVNYVQMLVCDATTPTQCGAVSVGGAQKVDGSAVTQPVSVASGAVQPGAYPNGASTAQGGTTDAPCTLPATTTACSQVAVEKAIANGVAGAVPVNVNGAVTAQTGVTPGSAQTGTVVGANTDQTSVGGVAVLKGAGATGTGSPRQTVAQDASTVAGSAPVKGGVGVVNGGSAYNTVAASASAQVLSATQGGGTGALGDYLSHCDIVPATTSPGAVSLTDGSGSAITVFTGGASSVSNLVTFPIPFGAVSISGGWKLTTGTNVSAVCYGKFS